MGWCSNKSLGQVVPEAKLEKGTDDDASSLGDLTSIGFSSSRLMLVDESPAGAQHRAKPRQSKQLLPSYEVMFAVLSLAMYIGAGVFLGIYVEGWEAIDTFYFITATLTTVGYGDVAPVTKTGRILCSLFIMYGTLLLTWLLGFLTRYFAEKLRAKGPVARRSPRFSSHSMFRKMLFSNEYKTARAVLIVLTTIMVGCSFLYFFEGLTYTDSFYLCVATLSTVGYGDVNAVYPLQFGTKLFLILYILVGTVSVAKVLGASIEAVLEKEKKARQRQILHQRLSLADLQNADEDNSGTLSESEFLIFKLRQMGIVTLDDIDPIKEQFRKIDEDNSGQITFQEALMSG